MPTENPVKMHNSPQNKFPTPGEFFKAAAPFLTTIGMAIAVLLLLLFLGDRLHGTYFNAPLKNFDTLISSNGYHNLRLPSGESWQIEYEQDSETIFQGTIRYISLDHETNFPILSHDLLITTEDYSDPELVETNVSNHHFSWQNLTDTSVSGSIHLLHIVPINQEIFEQLLKMKNWDKITLTGFEIQKIDAYSADGKYLGYWTDSGCNTILITAVNQDN